MGRTAQQIVVRQPGAEYRARCNNCGWESGQSRTTLDAARSAARNHAAECAGASS